jgi:23S rRNA (adenine1618-N6)-methyltransferase
MNKSGLHPRNRFRERYNFPSLIAALPSLEPFVSTNAHGDLSLDYSDPEAVKSLNRALLKSAYRISDWDIPAGNLCPPIPGRSDYIHYLADLIGPEPRRQILDIGTGANCIYPILGVCEYGWKFVGSDIDPISVKWAQSLVSANRKLRGKIEIRLQNVQARCFAGIIKNGEYFEATMCNPPFHSSAEEAAAGTRRKLTNLGISKSALNFGGKNGELWCPGGELAFIRRLILESVAAPMSAGWFTTLVSKSAHVAPLQRILKRANAAEIRVIEMTQGQKKSRILAWRFRRTSHDFEA